MNYTELKESYGTLSETIIGLSKIGYTVDFNAEKECLICLAKGHVLKPDDFQIDKLYRFEGQSNPDDQSILYAISSPGLGIKGILVDGYGISSDEIVARFVEKLQTINQDQSVLTNSIDPTPQRPFGQRIIDASLVEINLIRLIYQLKNEITWRESDRNAVSVLHSDSLRIVLMGLHKKSELKTHKNKGMVSIQVLEGKIQFQSGEHQVILLKGQMIAVHKEIDHSVIAIEESFLLLTFAMSE